MKIETKNLQLTLSPGHCVGIRDLTVPSGQKWLIEGPSGCGKTSLLHTVGLLRPPSQGQVLYNGDPVLQSPTDFRRRNFAFVFQRLSLIGHLTIEENIRLDEIDSLDSQILQDLQLIDRQKELVQVLSLGEQQRVALARALTKRAPLLLADEPTSSLDRPLAERIGRRFQEMTNTTVLVVSHDERIRSYFDRVLNWKEILK